MTQPDLFMRRTAQIEGNCRFTAGRHWDDSRPAAAWLLTNPSSMDAEDEDPTGRRMIRFTRDAGCGGFVVVNMVPLRTPSPSECWKMLAAGALTDAARAANREAIAEAGRAASVLFVGFGPEVARRFPDLVTNALGLFSTDFSRPLLCFGTTDDGWPLHPLARGRFAIPNGTKPKIWHRPAHGVRA